jgi:hypothetical protein
MVRCNAGERAVLERLIWASHLARGAEPELSPMLQEILGSSLRNNLDHRVSGLLIAHDGWFVQALEGPTEGVDAVFARICEDDRHTTPTVLERGPIEARAFGRWIMCARVLAGRDGAILGQLGIGRGFDPVRESVRPVLPLLLAVAREHTEALSAQHEHLATGLSFAA